MDKYSSVEDRGDSIEFSLEKGWSNHLKRDRNFIHWENPGSALVTGASSGIGAIFAYELAKQGFKIILVARREKKLQDVAQKINQKTNQMAEIVTADLAKQEDIDRVVGCIITDGNVEVLVNCAGYGLVGKFSENPIKKELTMMQVHNIAPVQFCRAVLPSMLTRNRGAIINVSSLATFILIPQNITYSATKSFINTFSQCLALELRKTNIRIQALCPGYTISEFHSVGDFKGFNRSLIPKSLWMTAEKTVEKSLEAFRKNKVIVIPGFKNRFLVWFWNRPILGKILRRKIIK